MKNNIFKNPKFIFILLLVSLFILFLLYYNLVITELVARNNFVNQTLAISDENEESIFNVQQITFYSSADVTGNSPDEPLDNLTISQYTDLFIYIDNLSLINETSPENTVKELYIDNITTTTKIGTNILNYKNADDFGIFKLLEKPEENRIDFNIVHTNEQNQSADYSSPTFFSDCSNPITLSFINTNLLTDYSVSEDLNSITYNGKVLEEAGIPIENINTTIKFHINIVNNANEKFVYNMELPIDLSGIYNGHIYKTKDTVGESYRFFKEV